MNRNKSFKVKRNSASYCSLLPLLFIMFCMNDVKGQNKKWEAPGSAGDLKNPLAGNTEVLKDAKVLYLSYCTPCHGSKGRGDGVAAAALHPKPADHTSATVQDESDGALYWMMTAGRNSMPSYKTVLSDKQRWELVNYIRTLASVRKTKSRTVKASPVAKSTSKKAEITSKTEPPKNKTTATDPKIATTDIAVKNEDASADTTIIATDSADAEPNSSSAQETEKLNADSGGSQKFLFSGMASAMFSASKDGNTFVPMTLMLMPLVKINDRVFLETGVKMQMEDDGSFGFGLEVLNLHYRINPWMSAHFGKFAAPWGNILDMFGEGFVSRFPVSPIGFADDGMSPTDQVGFGLQGGLQAGMSKMLYDVYVVNGPQLIVDEGPMDGNMTGHMSYESLSDNNKNKAIGGKIGILPFSNSSLQLDAFGQYAGKTGDKGTAYQNLSSSSYGVDLNFYKIFSQVLVRIMGQYEETNTQRATYTAMADSTSMDYTFSNKGNAWYVAGTVRPTGSDNNFIKNVELGARYVKYAPPKYALWGGAPSSQVTFDLTYWFTWSSQLNFGYNIVKEHGSSTNNQFIIRGLYKF